MEKIKYSIVAYETEVFSVALREEPPKMKKTSKGRVAFFRIVTVNN